MTIQVNPMIPISRKYGTDLGSVVPKMYEAVQDCYNICSRTQGLANEKSQDKDFCSSTCDAYAKKLFDYTFDNSQMNYLLLQRPPYWGTSGKFSQNYLALGDCKKAFQVSITECTQENDKLTCMINTIMDAQAVGFTPSDSEIPKELEISSDSKQQPEISVQKNSSSLNMLIVILLISIISIFLISRL